MQFSSEINNIKDIILNSIEAEKIYLFGSYAYGNPNENSDYDFFIIIPDNSIRPADAMQRINKALYGKVKKPVDILVRRSSDFNIRKNLLTIESEIAKQGVVLYG